MSEPAARKTILRYTPSERINHWIVALAFVLAGLSGLALFHPALFWLSDLFGGGPWTRILHPFAGLLMLLFFLLLASRFWRHNVLDDNDREWLRNIGDVINNREDRLPPVGRYNAGQKLLFYTIVLCLLGLLLSGLVIWRAYFSFMFPVGLIRAAALLHAFCAFVLIASIVVHIYAAIWVKGTTRAMTRGSVPESWARQHHPRWAAQMTQDKR